MKIALAHKRLDFRGGTERVFFQTALGLRDRGHEVHLFCQKFCVPVPAGVAIHRIPGLARPRTARLLTFGMFAPLVIKQFGCDVIVSFDRLIQQDLFRSGGGPHKVFIEKMRDHGGRWKSLWYRVSPYHRLALAIEKRQLSATGSRRIVAVCEQTKREMIEAYGMAEKKIVVIHNGVDHARFNPCRREAALPRIRGQLGIPDDSQVVLFVGSGFRRKGLDRLLRLWREPTMSRTYLVVVGNDVRLSGYKAAWRHEPRVIFAGPRSAVEEFYAAADLLVLPSIQEAFGNVVLEALATGLPVVSVKGIGALDKVEGDLRTGILENPDDPGELQKRISWLLDPARWPELSRQARQAAEKYSWKAYIENFEAVLFELCEEAQPQRSAAPAAILRFSDSRRTR
jgi:UDP-glucose:(heptosyl)LPS alpha-1,3-glucosyltransferase